MNFQITQTTNCNRLKIFNMFNLLAKDYLLIGHMAYIKIQQHSRTCSWLIQC